MSNKTWKAVELKICRMLGGDRTGPTGRDTSDCVHPWLGVEIKTRKRVPGYIRDWVEQAKSNIKLPGRLPIVVWHQTGDRYTDALVLLRLGDFLDWFVGGRKET